MVVEILKALFHWQVCTFLSNLPFVIIHYCMLLHTGYEDDVQDIVDVCNHIQNESLGLQVSMLIGHSRGSNDVLLFSARHMDVVPYLERVSAIAGRFYLNQLFPKIFSETQLQHLETHGEIQWTNPKRNMKINLAEKRTLEHLCMGDEVSRISSSVRVQIVHGTSDERIPCSDAYKFHERISNSELSIIEEANHGFNNDVITSGKQKASSELLLESIIHFLSI